MWGFVTICIYRRQHRPIIYSIRVGGLLEKSVGSVGVRRGSVGGLLGLGGVFECIRWSIIKSVDEKRGMTPARKLRKVMNWDEET